MTAKINEENERVKRKYGIWKREARRADEATIDKALAAITEFVRFTKGASFKAFNVEQAIGFKRYLEARTSRRTGKPLSKATIDSTLRAAKDFFTWLVDQPGYRSKIKRPDLEYFNLNAKDVRVAHTDRGREYPTAEQCLHAFQMMPEMTELQRRDKAIFALLMLTGARDGALASLRFKHIDLNDGRIVQDPREVRTKASKWIETWFFPVDTVYLECLTKWIVYLRKDKLFGPSDPVFPKPLIIAIEGQFKVAGLMREPYASASHVRDVIGNAFTSVGLPKFKPHSFRTTLAELANEHCRTPAHFKAWSMNLGHESISTTLWSYTPVSVERQRELMKAMSL